MGDLSVYFVRYILFKMMKILSFNDISDFNTDFY